MWQIIIVLSIEKCDEIYDKLQTNSNYFNELT